MARFSFQSSPVMITKTVTRAAPIVSKLERGGGEPSS